MKTTNIIRQTLENRKDKSAWNKGVTLYALELLDSIKERAEYEKEEPANYETLKEYALNGARNWTQYSYSGNSLIYDRDIARRLCNPSELKKTRNGERHPNSRENWLNVQARALFQAFHRISAIYANINR